VSEAVTRADCYIGEKRELSAERIAALEAEVAGLRAHERCKCGRVACPEESWCPGCGLLVGRCECGPQPGSTESHLDRAPDASEVQG
jgi:hypothetical protein